MISRFRFLTGDAMSEGAVTVHDSNDKATS
jgi:hypothetical protein